MSTSANATKISFDDTTLWVELDDGRGLAVPLAWFPRLLNATDAQRQAGRISFDGSGLHWEEIDEDISVAGLLAGRSDRLLDAEDKRDVHAKKKLVRRSGVTGRFFHKNKNAPDRPTRHKMPGSR